MPAIQPARLKRQAAELADKFDQPAAFVRALHNLLSQYADHTHRPGQAGEPPALLDSYNCPPPVMRQVWQVLLPLISLRPEAAFGLCDALWAEPNLDLRLLAAQLLGQLPVQPPEPVLERLQSWVRSTAEERLLDGLLHQGLMRLQQDAPERLLELVTIWLASSELPTQQTGLRALLLLITETSTENLPTIFRLLTPFLRIAPSRLRPNILTALTALAQRSPYESAYILRQNLTAPDNPDTAWLIRQVLDEFPEETKAGLRAAMKGMG
jgi:DNA alkylation repair enzyme